MLKKMPQLPPVSIVFIIQEYSFYLFVGTLCLNTFDEFATGELSNDDAGRFLIEVSSNVCRGLTRGHVK